MENYFRFRQGNYTICLFLHESATESSGTNEIACTYTGNNGFPSGLCFYSTKDETSLRVVPKYADSLFFYVFVIRFQSLRFLKIRFGTDF